MTAPQPEKSSAASLNRSTSPESTSREGFAVFLLCLVIFLAVGFWTSRRLQVFSAEALNAAWLAKILGFGRFPLASDSRLFLLPLPVILQMPLMAIPALQPDVSAGLVISAFSAALLGALLFRLARVVGLSAPLRWLLLLSFITNPFILVESASGSPLMLLMCLFFSLLFFAFHWLKIRNWLTLVNLGMAAALAVITRFNALVLVSIPLILVGISALWEKPEQPEYAENAIWIIATPVVYILLSRFFFSGFLTGNAVSFSGYDARLPLQLDMPATLSELGSLRFLGPSLAAFVVQISHVFLPIFPILALLIIVSALNFRWNNILFLAFCCLPVALAYSETEIFLNRYLLFIIPAGLFLLILALELFKRGKTLTALAAVLLILAFNANLTLSILESPNPSEQRTFLSSWLRGSPRDNFSGAVEMATFIDQRGLEPILILDQTAGPVVAFSAVPARFISPLDADFRSILSNLKNYQGYLLLSSAQPPDFNNVLPGLTASSSAALEKQVGGWYLISITPEFSQ